MAVETNGADLGHAVALLGAGVVAVPMFRWLGLGSVLGYLAAGVAIGPFGLALFTDPDSILHIAELGVVMFLFLIGLEMQPSRLWALRRSIFGLGAAQVVLCGALLTGAGVAAGMPPVVAFVAAAGFVMTSTAVVMQILDERGDTATPAGQRFISILLFEDLSIVPLLAIVALLGAAAGGGESGQSPWVAVGIAVASIAALVAAGRWLLNPLFGALAKGGAREVMTAAALLVVLGSALLMQLGGLSMAMGAFAAGVLLSESTFRHQLEAEIQPFRGLLLGLFFLGVGMALDLSLILRQWTLILAGVVGYMALKAAGIYLVARVLRATNNEALYRAAVMAQGGEFAFVLYSAATHAELIDATTNAMLTAMVILSMALTPLLVIALRWLPGKVKSMEGVEEADGLSGTVLIVGFGRVGQVMSQLLLARGIDVSIIDTNTDMIRSAADFGFKVYYGDGTRLDVLKLSGAGEAKAIAVCTGNRDVTNRIVELAKSEFPLAKLIVRSYDREHALKLIEDGVNLQVRETFESAVVLGDMALRSLGVPIEEAAEIVADIRRRDRERFRLEIAGGGLKAGAGLLIGNKMKPTPLVPPKRGPAKAAVDGAAAGAGAPQPAASVADSGAATPAAPVAADGRT